MITNYVMQNQKSKIIEIKMDDAQDTFHMSVDRTKLLTEGHELVKNLLLILQTYKSAGAVERARKFYDLYSQVPENFTKIAEIIKKDKKPGSLREFINTVKASDLDARMKTESIPDVKAYPESIDGVILSFAERYPFTPYLYKEVMAEWNPHKEDLRVSQEEANAQLEKARIEKQIKEKTK